MCYYRSCYLLLTGYFNEPSVNWESHFPEALTTAAEPFVDLILLHDLKKLVNVPTRIQTIFLFSNGLQQRKLNIEVIEGISDHKMVTLTMNLNCGPKVDRVKRTFPVISHASDVDILDAFDGLFLSFAAQCQSDRYSAEHV